ncbi:MAG: branched chain amino acid aminotransferase [Bacteroidetes bacterium 43-93]|nr:branched-chain amino acid aminotransferase [Bacteroidota bacterium]OJX00473.1 MAG: branched chain amino acid aminotransferase [Bacteroidetes bacterium 43-93]
MSVSTMDIHVQKVEKSRINQLDPNNIQFGKLYADHMLIANYEDGEWKQPEIVPFGNLSLSPATTFMHYGQAIFEGVKAYKDADGNAVIFRPQDNWKRMNRSAHRMGMPDVPEELFIEGMRELVKLDKNWIPTGEGTSLYIRPFMIATDEFIGVKPAEKFSFIIITSPAGPYYARPVNIFVQDQYVRAFPGGIGFTKAAGNYGASMYPTMEIRKMGYDQILWTDGLEHKYVQEIGTMNVFFVIGDKVITPNLGETILAGVTRDSVITLLREKGVTVEERPLSIDEIVGAYKNGTLKEAFGTGTAASISHIAELTYHDLHIVLPEEKNWEVSDWVKQEMNDIRYGRKADTHGWIVKL